MSRVCLNMIVRDEEKVLPRCLASVAHFVDCVSICDTGSTDSTKQIIAEFCIKHELSRDIHAIKFENFAQARNEALRLCKESDMNFDYILFMDAEGILHVEGIEEYTEPIYMVRMTVPGISYRREALIRRDVVAKYVGAAHEYLQYSNIARKNTDSIWIEDLCDNGIRYDKDIRNLNLLLKSDLNDPRTMFYLARTYMDMGDYYRAIVWFNERIKAGGWDEEQWYAAYSVATCHAKLNNESKFIKASWDAYNMRPSRVEPLYWLMHHYQNTGKDNLVKLLGNIITNAPYPNDVLFVEDKLYSKEPIPITLPAGVDVRVLKYDLRDVTFTIPARIDTPERERNLFTIIRYLQKYFDTNIIVGEEDAISRLILPQNCSHYYVKSEDKLMHRTAMLNQMARMSRTPIIVNCDTDVLLNLSKIITAVQSIRDGKADMVIPHDGKCVYLNEELSQQVSKTLDINNLNATSGSINNYIAAGGIVFFNKSKFLEGGGENEKFIGWGCEDDERLSRFTKLGYKVERLGGHIYHLNHPRTNSDNNHSKYFDNLVELNKVRNMDSNELRIYIKSWPNGWIDLSKINGTAGREDFQSGWQICFGNCYNNVSILDVGAGLCKSKSRLEGNGKNNVTLQDVAPNLPVDTRTPIEQIPDKSYDVVTAFDVIEHVQDDKTFLNHLKRIAKKAVVITTPNYNVSKNLNPYHCREYTPQQLLELAGFNAKFYAGTPNGSIIKVLPKEQFVQHNEPHQAFVIQEL